MIKLKRTAKSRGKSIPVLIFHLGYPILRPDKYLIFVSSYFQLIKQSQMILNFLALESRITNEHIDCIWAAGQVRH